MTKPTFFQPSFADVLFSVKTFIAAMLALLVTLVFDLQNPFWALTTVYIVSNPLSGASTSKAVYRLIGTAVGGVVTVALVPNLVNSPELLTAAISLWIGLCLAISLLDRTPKSYAFLLAGYTTALTAFPIVSTPDLVFTNATARITEIAVGILSAALVSRLFFPRHAGPVLTARINGWLSSASEAVVKMLEGQQDDPAFKSSVRRLAADAVDIRGFTAHVAYDTSGQRDVVHLAKALQTRMVVVLPMISALSGAWQVVEARDERSSRTLVDEMTTWFHSGLPLSEELDSALTRHLDAVCDGAEQLPADQRRLVQYTVARTRDLIQTWNDCVLLRDDIVSGSRHQLGLRRFGLASRDWPMHRDYAIAIHSGVSTIIATLVATTFWIMTGWPQGGTAAMMAAVLCCIFSTMDDPTPAMRGFLSTSVMAVIGAFCLEYGILPAVDGYIPLVAAFGLFLIPSGVLMARPQTFITGLGFSMMLPTLIAISGRLDLNFETFINGNLAIVLGFAIAWGTTAIVRSMSGAFAARRFIRAGWKDIASSATASGDEGLSHRMIDRIGLIAPRIANLPGDSSLFETDVLHDLRDAFNISELQRHRGSLPKPTRRAVRQVLDEVGVLYKRRLGSVGVTPDNRILFAIDEAENLVSKSDAKAAATESCRVALAGLRYSLFPHPAIDEATLPIKLIAGSPTERAA